MLPTTEASVDDGVIAFMNAALGLRFAPDFFAFLGAAFLGAAFLADFFAAGFLAGFLAAFFEDFFAAFLAVAIILLPGLIASLRAMNMKLGQSPVISPLAPSEPNIPQSRTRGEQISALFIGEAGLVLRRRESLEPGDPSSYYGRRRLAQAAAANTTVAHGPLTPPMGRDVTASRSRSSRRRALAPGFLLAGVLAATVACADPFDHGLLWRLERPGVPPSYIFGTLHSADPRVTRLPATVVGAFASCRSFAMEIHLSDADEARFFEATQFEDGQRLEPLLGANDYARLREILGDQAPAEDILARTKPWAALLRIASPRVASAAATLDDELFATAMLRRMGMVGLELPDEQIVALDSIPIDSQIALLRHAIEHRPLLEARLESTIRAWLDRDLATIARINLASADGDPALERHQVLLTRRIVDDRSALMMYRLFLPLRAGGVFVAVGALHLHGAKGMLAQLKAQGYKLRRVY